MGAPFPASVLRSLSSEPQVPAREQPLSDTAGGEKLKRKRQPQGEGAGEPGELAISCPRHGPGMLHLSPEKQRQAQVPEVVTLSSALKTQLSPSEAGVGREGWGPQGLTTGPVLLFQCPRMAGSPGPP